MATPIWLLQYTDGKVLKIEMPSREKEENIIVY
jgi:hypothetical protein